MLCPICTEFQMTEKVDENTVYYKNRPYKLTIEFSYCPLCGEQSNTDQLKRNKQRMVELKERVDNEESGI